MRTIKQNLFNRLVAQAEEAEVQGLTKVAMSLTDQLESVELRPDRAAYVYENEAYQKDIEQNIWKNVIRTADFHNKNINNAEEMQELVERLAEEMIAAVRTKLGCMHGVGAYETPVAGQEVEIEIEE